MILDITADQVARLSDTDLRTLIAHLCECEVRAHGHSVAAVTWGGHQNAGDGGIDVRVALPAGALISGYVPKPLTGFQVKAQDMPKSAILNEMAPDGVVLPSIAELAANGGAYVMVSAQGSVADKPYQERKAAIAEAVAGLAAGSSLTLDFYDRRRIASWVNQHPGLVPWVREKLGLPLSGWRPFEDWSSSPTSVNAPYLLDEAIRLVGPSIKTGAGLNAGQALALLRGILAKPRGIIRLVGLSGVGKTRLIQALFDERVGDGALPRSDALYTDLADGPDPVPQEMLSRLISTGQRVIMIVDNCGAELHHKLASKMAHSNCALSLITVEYDITDDEPQHTDLFKLEPASASLIEQMLESRYPDITPSNRYIIANFSEGNARVAFALAGTAKHGESLVNLRDTDLFERLFHQQKRRSRALLDAAKVCALLYSFDGETLAGQDCELAPLARLAGQTVDELYQHIAELQRRQLIQKRGRWRAILPHALAHRLAKRALEDIPLERIENALIAGSSPRMLRSFSRRIGYLHDHAPAIALVGNWLRRGGVLEQLGKLEELGEKLFANVAPVNPAATLAFIEDTAARNPAWFYGQDNKNRDQIIDIIRCIAYDPALFERCVISLQRFALKEMPQSDSPAVDSLRLLFWIYLSGTHASAAQRISIIEALLQSTASAEQELAITLLDEMLKTTGFKTDYSFEFGAWKRDYGFSPSNASEVRDWYTRCIEVVMAADTNSALSARVRQVMASHVLELLHVGLVDEVMLVIEAFTQSGGWPEGWVGVRNAIRQGKGRIPDTQIKQLKAVELHLRPNDLAGMIRAYVLLRQQDYVALAILDDEEGIKPDAARQRVYDICRDLGQQLAQDPERFDVLLPEILTAERDRSFAFGRGLAIGCDSLSKCWDCLKVAFLEIPEDRRRSQLPAGFLVAAMARAPDETEALLDVLLADSRFHPYLLDWQSNVATDKLSERLMKAVGADTVPVSAFQYLYSRRTHEKLDDEQLRTLLCALMAREGSGRTVAGILSRRISGRRTNYLPITEALKAAGYEFLAKVEWEKDMPLEDIADILKATYDKPKHENEARAFCARVIAALEDQRTYGGGLMKVAAALAEKFPHVVLDMLEGTVGRPFLEATPSGRWCPTDGIPSAIWLAWAAHRPDTRYTLLAQVMRFIHENPRDYALRWSVAATELIEVAPDPMQVLDTFLERFRVYSSRSTFAAILAGLTPLIEALKQHARPEVTAWVKDRGSVYAAWVERERAGAVVHARVRDEKFE